MTSIRPLSEAVSSSVRSGIFLFDLTRVVEELVFNSLDAGAKKVAVFVDIGRCCVKVFDDGTGIPRDGLEMVGQRYATSKFFSLADMEATSGRFGFRGEALASISDISLLEIVTRTHGRPNGYRKVLKGCKCLYLGIDNERKDVGTTVIVRDLFYNQPVRRKCIQSSSKKGLQSVKKCVLRLALVHPMVSFRVVDIVSEDELLCTHPSSSPLSLLMSSFGVEISKSLKKLEVHDGKLKISGYMSIVCDMFIFKGFQYVYINSQFICKGPIHKLLNQLAEMFEHVIHRSADSSLPSKKRSRPACPAYLLNLSCPRSLYDLTFEPSKTCVEFKDWNPILGLFKKAVEEFWIENTTGSDHISRNTNVELAYEQEAVKNSSLVKAESGRRKGENPSDLFTSSDNIFTVKDGHPAEYSGTLQGFLDEITAEDELNTIRDSICQSRCAIKSFDPSLSKFTPHMTQQCDVLWMSDDTEDNYSLHEKHSAPGSSSMITDDNSLNVNAIAGVYSVQESHMFSDAAEATRDVQKPFLSSCSMRESISPDGDFFANDVFGLPNDVFSIKSRRNGPHQEVNGICSPLVMKSNMLRSSDIFSSAYDADICPQTSLSSSNLKISLSELDEFLISNYGAVYSSTLPQATWNLLNDDEDRKILRSQKLDDYMDFFGNEQKDHEFICRSAGLDKSISSWNLAKSNNICAFDFPEMLIEGTDWMHNFDDKPHWYSSTNERKKCEIGNSNFEHDHLRSRRSLSAPPFHRSRRKCLTLSNTSTMIARRPNSKNVHHLLPCQRRKHDQIPLGIFSSDSQQTFHDDFRGVKRVDRGEIPDAVVDLGIKEAENFDDSLYSNSQSDAPIKGLISKDICDSLEYGSKWREHIPQIPKSDKVFHNQKQSYILDVSSGLLHLAGDSLVPETISKKCFNNAKVLPQVDKKFIPIVAGRTLAVIDQHAADERIRLEELREKVLCGEGKTITFLDGERELVLPETVLQLLQNFSDHVRGWGWICNIHSYNAKSYERNMNLLNGHRMVITLLAVPCILGVNLTDADLMEFLQQLSDTDGSSTMPPSVVRLLNSKACRGAIMFGDSLLPSECSLIVEELKQTSLCFQCAHGRPTTIPIVDLEALHNQIANLESMNECSNKDWHGLRKHEISLERATQRFYGSG